MAACHRSRLGEAGEEATPLSINFKTTTWDLLHFSHFELIG